MWTPVQMVRILLVALDEDVAAVTEEMGRRGVVQLSPFQALGGLAGQLGWRQAEDLRSLYAGFRRRISQLLKNLDLGPAPPAVEPMTIAPREMAESLTGELTEIERFSGRIMRRQAEVSEELSRLALVAQQLELLAPLPIDLGRLRELEFLYLAAALVPQRNLDRLRGSLAGVPHVLLEISRQDGYVLILAFASREQQGVLEQALRSAYAQDAEIPREFTGTPRQALGQLEARRDELSREGERVAEARRALAAEYQERLWRMEREVTLNEAAVEAWSRFGATERTRLITGWLPAEAAPGFAASLTEQFRGLLVVRTEPPPPARSEPEPGTPVPTYLRNLALVRPFEALVTTFGVPNYYELDPTPVAGPLFVVMFGIMFGDLGLGAVIAIAGALLARGTLLGGNKTFGWILLAAGVSSIFFGVLFGTVFLSENVIPALAFGPLDNLNLLIALSIAFGAGVLTLALGLNLADAARARDAAGFLLGRRGLVGLWFYWGTIIAVLALLTGRTVGFLALLGLVVAPLIVMFLRDPLEALLAGRGIREAWPGGQALVQSAIEVFDTAVRYVSNTISFIRLAAFAIAHVGIGIVVFTLATLVRFPPVGAIIVVLGNAFVLALAGLVAFIQALRLDYYEFFTKFFRAGGVPFQPFLLPGPAQGARRQEG